MMLGMPLFVARRWLWLARTAVVALLALVGLAILHAPPVRARVLAMLISRLERTGIVAHADWIEYNLTTFDVRLHRVTLATTTALATPFLTADDVHAALGWGILRGRITVTLFEVTHPRIVLVRNEQGVGNWPASDQQSASTSPVSLDLGRVDIPDLDVMWQDARAGLTIDATGLSLRLAPSGAETTGPLRLSRPGRIQLNDQRTTIDVLEGRLSWNGRDLSIDALHVVLPEGQLHADGRVDEGRLNLRVAADANLAALAPWAQLAQLNDPLSGALHVDAAVTGSVSTPDAALTVNGRDISAAGLHGVTIEAAGRIAGDSAELSRFTARVASGTITARGRMVLAAGSGAIRLDWRQLDLATLMRPVLRGDSVRLAARVDGSLDAQWSAPRADALRLRGEARSIGSSGDIGGGPPIDGSIALELQHQRWTLRAEQTLDHNARATADISGSLSRPDVFRSSVTGLVHLSAPDVARLSGTLARAGLVETPLAIRGAALGDFSLNGTIGDPRLEGTLEAVQLRYESVGPATLHARAAATSHVARLDEIEGRLGESSAHGRVQLTIDTRQLEGRFDASLRNLTQLSSAIPLAARPEGTFDVRASVAGSLTSPQLDVTMTTEGLEVAGQQIDRADAHVSAIGSAITIHRLRLESGEGRLDASGQVDLTRRTYIAHATAVGLPIRPLPGENGAAMVPIRTRLSGQVDGEGSFANPGGRARLSFVDTSWADASLGAVDADLTASGRRVSVDLRAPDLQLTGSGNVGIGAGDSVSANGRWDPTDLAALSQRLGWSPPFPLTGSGSMRFEVSGPRDRPDELRIASDLDRLSLDVDGEAVRLAQPARLEYDARTLRVRNADLTVGGSHLTIAGSLGDPTAAGLVATLQGSVGDFEFLQHFARPPDADHSGLPPPEGSIAVRLNANGSLAAPILSGSLQLRDGRLPITMQAAITDTNLTARLERGVLAIDDLRAAFQGATLTASGQVPIDLFSDRLPQRLRDLVPRTGGPANLTALLSSVTPQAAAPFVDRTTLESIAGRVDAVVDLRADRAALDRVAGTVVLNRAELSLSGVSFDQQTPTRLLVHDGRVDVAAWDWGRADNHVILTGGVSLGDAHALDITAKTALNMGLLNAFTRTGRTAGRADGEIRLGGTVAAPTIDGFVTFAEGELRMNDPRLIVTDLTGTVTLNRDALTLERIYATVNGGAAEIAGSIHHRWFQPLDGQITLRARDAAIDLSGLRAEADADLAFSLEQRGPTLAGTLTLLRGAYREPLSLTGGLLQSMRASSGFVQPGTSSALEPVQLDIRIVTQDDLLIDNNYAQLTAAADLRLAGTPAQPAVVGRAALSEGGLIFFGGRRYRLATQGSIDFVNTTRIEPILDLRAVTRAGGTEITLAIKGAPATLETTLTSDDPTYSQSDLISLLVTGRTAAESASAGYAVGREELIGYLSGELFGAAGRAVGLDTLRVEQGTPDLRFDAGLVAGETDPGARLTFGKNIGRRAQVVFSQSLRNSGGTTWIVSYAPQSRIELRAVSLDNGDRLYGFRHDLIFGASTPASARTPPPEPPKVTRVQVSGAGPDEAALRSRLTLRAGDRFSFFRWQDDRDRLELFYQQRDRASARVTTRRVAAQTPGTQVVEIVYDVRPGPRTSVVIEGVSFPNRVVDAMKRAWTHAVVDEFLTEEVVTIARGELVDRGFVRSSVAATLENAPDAETLRVAVDPGPHVDVQRVVFRGNERIPSVKLFEVIANPTLARSVWLEPAGARDALIAFYRREGYLSASVTVEEIAIDGDGATRVIDVDEGEPFRLRDVRVDGARASSADDIRKMSALSSGEIYSEDLIDRARRAIIESYRSRGFNNLGLTLRIEAVAGQPDVDVAIALDEGPQQRVRDIAIAGLVRTNPELVRRALKLEAGQPVNLAEWATARQRLYETGVFRSVDIQPEPIPIAAEPSVETPAGLPEQPIRSKVTLAEWPAVRLRYGLEVDDQLNSPSDTASTFALAPLSEAGRVFDLGIASDISARNLFGNAISVGLAGRYTRDFRAARAYATSPYFFGRRITSTVFLSRSRELVVESAGGALGPPKKIVADKTDLTFEQRLRPFPKTEVAYRYALERNHTFDLLPPSPENPIPFDVPANVARLASTVLVDTRNDLVDATRGLFHSSDFEYAPPALGSELRFAKYLLQQRYYRRVGSVVLASAARLGLATAFDQSLIPSERFFAGGGNSVRGYDEDTLGPRDRFGDVVGGNALLVLNEEIRFPIYRWVRGVGFFDAGRAFETVGSMTLEGLPSGTGVGLRVQTPIVLLRVDLAVPLDTTLGPRKQRWFFSIGQAF